jgi:hypothetical protein
MSDKKNEIIVMDDGPASLDGAKKIFGFDDVPEELEDDSVEE